MLLRRRPRRRDDVRALGKVGQRRDAGTWRQAHTALSLKAGAKASYGFRLQWASSYDELRDLLYANGLFDVRVVPGMTVPSDLSAKFSLRTKAQIESVTAEFPGQTTITPLGSPASPGGSPQTPTSTRSPSANSARTC
ncbi:MAG: hypothetical protein IPL75_16045 [Acidobacteria bacterium]|nr:hypothetical protein [Acidobacteriota bacterium]